MFNTISKILCIMVIANAVTSTIIFQLNYGDAVVHPYSMYEAISLLAFLVAIVLLGTEVVKL